ncbi:hypothetical protein Hanom_Chr16g01427711 [Helianthus anomalus]
MKVTNRRTHYSHTLKKKLFERGYVTWTHNNLRADLIEHLWFYGDKEETTETTSKFFSNIVFFYFNYNILFFI